MDAVSLIAAGEKLGLSGKDLKDWVDAQQALEREKRAADREAAKEASRLVELKLKLAETENARPASAAIPNTVAPVHLGLQKGMTPFDEKRDDLHSYLLRFERVA